MKNKLIRIISKTENEAELSIYGDIGESLWWDSISANDFKEQLDEVKNVKKLTVRINSPGGDVFDGVSIYNLIQSHKAEEKIMIIDGLAASIASIIALSGTEVKIGDGAMYMIHNPWTLSIGESKHLRKTADLLDNVKDQLISIYQKKTGMDSEELSNMMNDETWMGSDEAIEKGFVDSKIDNDEEFKAAASTKNAIWIKNKKFEEEPEDVEAKRVKKEIKERAANLQKEIRNFLARR